MGGRICKHYERNFYAEVFKVSLFERVVECLFNLKTRYENEDKNLMVELLKLPKNSSYGHSLKKIYEEYIIENKE